MMVASQSGSFNEDGPDIVPNEGMVELFLAFLGFLLIRKVELFHQGLLSIWELFLMPRDCLVVTTKQQ